MPPKEKRSIGEALVERKIITAEQLQQASAEARKANEHINDTVIRLGLAKEEVVAAIMGEIYGVPFAELSGYIIDPKTIALVSEAIATKYNLVPLFKTGNLLTVAMADPLNIIAIDEVRLKTKYQVEAVIATASDIKRAIKQYYGVVAGSIEDLVKAIDSGEAKVEKIQESEEGEDDLEKLKSLVEEAPIIKLVNMLLAQAVKDGASDIHVEPEEKKLRVRYRIDGILHDITEVPKHLQPAVISRIKIMADLNIAQKRAPQDGRFQIRIENTRVDVRTSSLPTIYGENVVMRILDTSSVLLGLEQIGMPKEMLDQFNAQIHRPYGIILVTGPTGSGKTTTLYSALNTINSPELNIITLEDPVEYRLAGIRQSQINPKAGLTFAGGLRSILRQDPDVIMVGEIRDKETAEIAVQAALTGHMVFSTLHTNDSPSSVTRLTDMGIEPFLISSSVCGVLAQRLVRTICKHCRETYTPKPKVLEGLELGKTNKEYTFQRGKGCKLCKDTGYKGRTGIYEFLLMNDEVKELTLNRASANVIKAAAQKAGMRTLRDDGLEKIIKGITTVDEVLRVTAAD